jgi:multicomponent Na+:H+ antiporter subunit D
MIDVSTALLLALAIPAAGSLLIALAGRHPNLREGVTLVTAIALFAVVIVAAQGADAAAPVTVRIWEFLPGLSIALHAEPLSVLFALIASGLWIVTSVYSIGYMRGAGEQHQTRFYVCFAIALFGAMGVAFSANLLTLFIAYEVLSLSTYPLVAHKQNENARSGARTYLLILLVTSIGLMLPAMLWVYAATGTLEFQSGGILAGHMGTGAAGILLLMFLLGVGKAAVMPVHRWLPAAMVAPTPVSALLHAVAVVKAGVFTVTKLVIYVFGIGFIAEVPLRELAIYMAAFTMIAASVVALRQVNLKRMLAYSTVAQLSYVVLAALVLAPLAAPGAALHIAAHAFGKITLFFTAGAIYVASKKTEIPQLDGIARRMPITMIAFAIGAFSMIGLPPTAGFVSKWTMVGGAFAGGEWFMIAVLAVSAALNAAYFLPVLYRAFCKPEAAGGKAHGEAPWQALVALSLTALLALGFLGFAEPITALELGILGGGR